MEKISMQDLYQRLPHFKEREVILDVRTPQEYQTEGHIDGSINIPHEEVSTRINELKKYERIYIHCRMGGRAQKAAQALLQAGFENLVCISENGINAWIEAGYPVTKGA